MGTAACVAVLFQCVCSRLVVPFMAFTAVFRIHLANSSVSKIKKDSDKYTISVDYSGVYGIIYQ